MKRQPSMLQSDFSMLLAPTDEEREAERQESVRRYGEAAAKLPRCPECGHTRTKPELPCPCGRNVPGDPKRTYYSRSGYPLSVQEIRP